MRYKHPQKEISFHFQFNILDIFFEMCEKNYFKKEAKRKIVKNR